ncbi:MAG: hypothetical protein ACOH2S_27135 [Janthinobacterium svalbardensis]
MFNVTRNPVAPLSLANKKSWRGVDVLREITNIFHNKCYLCEEKAITCINVEHLRPHLGELDKKFDWNNLYYSCSRCNNIKSDIYNNILDCAAPDVDVFKRIKMIPPHSPNGKFIEIRAMSDDQETLQTVQLLNEIYNGNDTANKGIASENLRRKVFRSYNKLYPHMCVLCDDEETGEKKKEATEKIKVLMSNKQEFSAFLRWVILTDSDLCETFEGEMAD